MKLRVLCDTNVLVSALIAAGPPSRLLEEAIDGRIALVLPEVVLDELQRALTEKLDFGEEQSRAARELLTLLAAERPGPSQRPDGVTGDPADDEILACAVEAQVDVFATGDRKHLLPIGEHGGVPILTPQALLASL